MNILHVMRVFHGSIDWAWAFVRVPVLPVLRSLPAVVTENSVRTENAEVPSIREILVLPR
jgi:hypothetical protein